MASLEGLVLGYSSGPDIVTTSHAVVVTAPDRAGNLYAWNRPMDGGDSTVNGSAGLNTIWQRNGTIFTANSSLTEQEISFGRDPVIAANSDHEFIAFTNGEDIWSITDSPADPVRVGQGNNPKVLALENGAVYFWANSAGINFKKVSDIE